MFRDVSERIDRLVEDLLRGRRLRATSRDAADRDAIMTAAELAAAREGYPRMSPAFRRKLTAALVAGEDPGRVTRRTALGAVAGLAAGAIGAAALGRLPSAGPSPGPTAASRPGPPGGIMEPAGGRWVEVAALSQLSETGPTRVVAGNLVAYLFRTGSSVTGVSGICTHLPCVLNWKADAGLLACPCHPVNFKPTGESTAENYVVEPLPQVRVKVEQERVFVFSG